MIKALKNSDPTSNDVWTVVRCRELGWSIRETALMLSMTTRLVVQILAGYDSRKSA